MLDTVVKETSEATKRESDHYNINWVNWQAEITSNFAKGRAVWKLFEALTNVKYFIIAWTALYKESTGI